MGYGRSRQGRWQKCAGRWVFDLFKAEGRQTIARRFNAGENVSDRKESRQGRKTIGNPFPAVPDGTCFHLPTTPPDESVGYCLSRQGRFRIFDFEQVHWRKKLKSIVTTQQTEAGIPFGFSKAFGFFPLIPLGQYKRSLPFVLTTFVEVTNRSQIPGWYHPKLVIFFGVKDKEQILSRTEAHRCESVVVLRVL